MSCCNDSRLLEIELDDHEEFQRIIDRSGYPRDTSYSEMSCTVVEVFIKDNTVVKAGDPMYVLHRPLPTRLVPPYAPLPECLKINIKHRLEQNQKHRSPTVVDYTSTTQTRIKLHHKNVDAAKLLLKNFNKFDTVVDYSDHLFSQESSPETQGPPKDDWVNKIKEDRRLLMENLPDTIFVRVYESRMDILRAAIIGQKGTPYHDGLFFFDVCFPSSYPRSPPLVRYHSGVPLMSPRLNKCGDVQFILSAEYARPKENMWTPGTSNILQLLVYIRDLILNAQPYYFNISGNVTTRLSIMQERTSFLYNENTVVKSLETMIYTMNKPPKNFEDLVRGHFHTRVHDILMACKAYIESQKEYGCLVGGSNHTPSIKFKKDLILCIKPLVKAFDKIGAKEAQGYHYLSDHQVKIVLPANSPTPICQAVVENMSTTVNEKKKAVAVNNEVTSESAKKETEPGYMRPPTSFAPGRPDALRVVLKCYARILPTVHEEINVTVNKRWNGFVSYFFCRLLSQLCPRFTNVADAEVERDRMVVHEETSDDLPTKEIRADEEIKPAAKKDRKVAVNDEKTNDHFTAKRDMQVLDTKKYHVLDEFTVPAAFTFAVSKVLIRAGMTINRGDPLYVKDTLKSVIFCLDYCMSRTAKPVVIKKSKTKNPMIQRILSANRSLGVGNFSMEDVLVAQEKEQDADLKNNLMARGLGNDVVRKYENFKKFDYVTHISDHFFSLQKSDVNRPSKKLDNKIREEWAILKKQLPETIYVRVDQSRMDLLRAAIIGPQGTPYRDGLFFFDVCFPSNYPISPPLVHYHSGGLHINPNLHKCGKVDLSLPRITGGQETMWVPGTSTILNLLVSIQNQILNTNPLYNDLTYAIMRGSAYGNLASESYNENCIVKSLKTMVHIMNRPPKNFEDFVVGHFRNRLQNVMEIFNMMAGSIICKDDLALCKKLIVAAFINIGAKVPQEFLPPS